VLWAKAQPAEPSPAISKYGEIFDPAIDLQILAEKV